MLVAYFGHHKAASSWIAAILTELAGARGWRTLRVHDANGWIGYRNLGARVRAERVDLLMHTNARRCDVDSLWQYAGFHVIRDPRDVIVSGYFSHLHSHPEDGWPQLVAHRERLRSCDIEQGLHAEIDFSAPFIHSMLDWDYHRPHILELRMEDLVADPPHFWKQILRHCGITGLSVGYVEQLLATYSFERLADGRKPGIEDQHHHYRRGIPGDWRNYLTPAHLTAIADRFGDLGRLGYS